jgi:hypothetical protein
VDIVGEFPESNVDPGRSGILAVPAPHQNFIFSTLFKLQLNNQNTIKLTI